MIKNDIIELTITGSGMDGEGVAKYDGIVVFVPMTLVGEVVLAKVTLVKKKFANAKVIKIITPSPLRREPICPHFFSCGGCSMMHIDYPTQLDIKRANLLNCLSKVAKVDVAVDDIVPSSNEYEYRNKIQLPLAMQNGKVVCGYYKEKTHIVVPFERCYLHGEWADEIVKIFIAWANRYKQTCYDESIGKGLLRHLILRKLGDKVAIVIVINGDNIREQDKLISMLREKSINFSLSININKKDTNVIMSGKTICVYGKDEIVHQVGGVKVAVSPNSFMQINDEISAKIYESVASGIASIGNPLVLEVYSGIGVLTNIMANSGSNVISCEIEPTAVVNADNMARLNNNEKKIVNICGDAGVVMPMVAGMVRTGDIGAVDSLGVRADKMASLQSIIANNSGRDIAVVLDPPRKGCDQVVLDAVLSTNPNYIYYVSCAPNTLARDLGILKERYDIVKVTPYDMFPNTSHVETLVVMKRK